MNQGVQENPITLQATSASIDPYLAVVLSSGKIAVATATTSQKLVGFTTKPVATDGYGAVDCFDSAGTTYGTLGATATTDDLLYTGPGGKLVPTSGGIAVGYAMDNGVADDVIQVLKSARATY
jgi:hypothetical protein